MLVEPDVYELLLTPWQQTLLRKRKTVASRSMLIAEFYIEMEFWRQRCEFVRPPREGADLTIRTNTGLVSFEVKGTADDKVAIEKLKVSSCKSFDLVSSGITVLRIMRALTTRPLVAELKYRRHFLLKREARWRATKGAE
jgi:hypothetical protein